MNLSLNFSYWVRSIFAIPESLPSEKIKGTTCMQPSMGFTLYNHIGTCLIHTFLLTIVLHLAVADFNRDFQVTWAPDHVKVLNSGQELHLTLDKTSGSAFASKEKYLFGNIDMQIKLVPGNSAGTVTAYYLSSESFNHDELDFEFLGNVSGQPYILQTNVFASGVGGREQRIYLWFDPTTDFHTYSVLWSPQHIIFSVDGMPIRVFPNNQELGVPYLNKQPMGVYSSIWNGDTWATRGGLVKIDWTQSPFVSSYRNFNVDACQVGSATAAAAAGTSNCVVGKGWNTGASQILDPGQRNKLRWVRKNYMIYDYCSDKQRYPTSPPDCNLQP